MGRRAAFGGIRHRPGGSVRRGSAHHPFVHLGRGGPRLHRTARRADPAPHRPRQRQNLPPKPESDATARRRRGDDRSGRRQRVRPVAQHRRANPPPRAAGSRLHQRPQPAARAPAQRAAGRAGNRQTGAPGAAQRAGWHPVRTRAPPARHQGSRGAPARRDRRYRRRDRRFLPVGQNQRQHRPAIAAIRPPVRPQFAHVFGRPRHFDPAVRGR